MNKNMNWVTKYGIKIKVVDMQNDHLLNAIYYCERVNIRKFVRGMRSADTVQLWRAAPYKAMVELAEARGLMKVKPLADKKDTHTSALSTR